MSLVIVALVAAGTNCDLLTGTGTDDDNPLVGTWSERVSLACDAPERTVDGQFDELIFRTNGTFSLTWFPFETFVDYWGTYTVDVDTGRLSMTITGGNTIPDSPDLEGLFSVQDDGSIRLDEMYFGPPTDDLTSERTCGYVIEK